MNAQEFRTRCIKAGQFAMILCIIANFIPGIYLWLFHGIVPSLPDLFQLWLLAAGAFGVSWVVQPLAYYSAIGTAGSYLSWVVGSVVDIRLPAVNMAQEIAKVEPGTEEGEVISMLGVSVSVFVSVSMVTIFTLAGTMLIPLLPAFITGSFNYILPALFGAVYINLAKKNMKMGLGTLAVALIVLYINNFVGIKGALINLLVVIMGMIVARCVYVMEKKNKISTFK